MYDFQKYIDQNNNKLEHKDNGVSNKNKIEDDHISNELYLKENEINLISHQQVAF